MNAPRATSMPPELVQTTPAPGVERFNPFAATLRPPMSENELSDGVARLPKIDPAQRALDAKTRLNLVMQLDDYVEPMPRYFSLESKISAMIRAGYVRRNPLPVAQQLALGEREGLSRAQCVTPPPVTLASGLSLLGFSGVGKTTAVLSILFQHPQIHVHTEFMGLPFFRTQITWMRVACPPTGGARALLMNIFQEIDRLLGTDYHQRHASGRRSAAELIPSLVELMSTLGVGLLVIDEIQRLVRMGPEDAGLLLDVFTHLRTESYTPVMLIGTPKAMRVLNSQFEQARRNTSMGNIAWAPMDNDEVWEFFVEQLWQYQWLKVPVPLTPKLRDALHFWSQGITDLAVKIFKMAQFNAIEVGAETLTPELFEQIVHSEFSWFEAWIPALSARLPALMNGALDGPFEMNAQAPDEHADTALARTLAGAGIASGDITRILAAMHATPTPSPTPAPDTTKPSPPSPAPNRRDTLWDMVRLHKHRSGHAVLSDAGIARLPKFCDP